MGCHWVTSRFKVMNRIRRSHLFYSLPIILFFFFLLAFLNTSPNCLVFRCEMAAKADFLSQRKLEVLPLPMMARVRRILYRLGSSPPHCNWKCGRCTPCKPVHVAVPPGIPVTTEYYPEAWRCKCGNRLYMP